MSSTRAPDRGDLVWLDFEPYAGSEQGGWCPALVLSPASYNRKVGLCLACPITSRIKGYAFEVELPPGLKVSGAVLCDQVKNIDWRARRATRIGVVTDAMIQDVTARVVALVDPEGQGG